MSFEELRSTDLRPLPIRLSPTHTTCGVGDSADQIRELRILSEKLGFDLANFISAFSNLGFPLCIERKFDGAAGTDDADGVFHLHDAALALLIALRTSKGKSNRIDWGGGVAHG